MQQLEFFSVPSPCVGVCHLDEKGYCLGCMRKRQERFDWLTMTPAEQKAVLRLCQLRYRRRHSNREHTKAQPEPIDITHSQDSLF